MLENVLSLRDTISNPTGLSIPLVLNGTEEVMQNLGIFDNPCIDPWY